MADRFNKERWLAVSPLLDQALELAGEERAAWLAGLRAREPLLTTDLEKLLEQHRDLQENGFLEDAEPPRPPQSSLAGQTIGAYTLHSQIGQGGMGSVWLAERSDGRFQGLAAVKLLNASLIGHKGEARFRREGSILARLRHPHIAQLIDAGVSPSGQPYFVLERVEGERIDRYCDGRHLGIQARIRLFLDVLTAVAHAHANLIVHRDLKPSNVLVAAEGQVKLLDFGIAKLLESDVAPSELTVTALTREGETLLTPEYAAPEQLTGDPVTTATDVYGLGVLLYVLLSGRHPVGANTSPAELMKAILDTEPVRVSEAIDTTRTMDGRNPEEAAAARGASPRHLRRLLEGDLDNIVAKALKKRPAERYPSVEALADDLRRYLAHEPVSARPDSLGYRGARFVRRNRTGVVLATLAGLAAVAGVVGTVSQARRATREAALAQGQRDFALRQLSRAEAINDLNTFVLYDAAPPGKPVTVEELLARAERIVERQREGVDDHRVELLVSIGRQRQLQEAHARARQVLTRAYELAARSPDPATRAEAACALASAIAPAGEHERAEELIQQAERDLPRDPQFALHRIVCLMRGSEVAQDRGDVGTGLERALASQRLLDQAGFASSLLRFRAASRVAESYRMAGRHREAASAFEQAFTQLAALGRGDTARAATVLNNWAQALHALGQTLEAELLFRQAIAIDSPDGTAPGASPMLLTNWARTLRDLDRLDEAMDAADRAYAKARQLGHEVVVNQVLLLRASVYRMRRDLVRAAAMLAEVEPRLARMVPAGHAAFAAVHVERALLAQAGADAAAAMSEIDRALAIAEASPQRALYLSLVRRRRAELALGIGRPEGAAADAREALRIDLEAIPPGTFSSNLGHAYLALGRALHAQGRVEDARAAFTSAARNLEPTLGAAHPATRSARQLALPESAASR
jgi:eukaryotic-like serine/threonine-protein kinase